jgi:hypothetical protein
MKDINEGRPMAQEKRYSAREVNRILRSILNEAKKKRMVGDGYTRGDIAATAAELGISEERVNRALAEHDQRKVKAKWFIKKHFKVAITTLILLGLLAWFFWPTPFSGSVKITMTSQVEDDFSPHDDLASFPLFYYDKAYCFLTFFNIHDEHKVKCIFYNPQKEPVSVSEITLADSDGTRCAFFPLDLLITTMTGTWRAKAFVDNTPRAEKEFKVELGRYTVTLASDVNEDDEPVNSLTSFSESRYDRVVCYLNWPKIKGEHLIEWNWINPSGEPAETDSLRISNEGGSHWAYNSLYLKNRPVGRWRVELLIDSFNFADRDFTITH